LATVDRVRAGNELRPPASGGAFAGVDLSLKSGGARLFAALPAGPTQKVTARLLRRFPTTYGMPRGGARAPAVVTAYGKAYPERDATRFVHEWSAARAEAMAQALYFLAQRTARGRSDVARTDSDGGPGGAVIAFLHTGIDPVPAMAMLDMFHQNAGPTYRWVMWPVHRGPETAQRWKDERDFLLRVGFMPPEIEDTLLPVTTADWFPTAIRHLRRGGRLLIAADAPFDGLRDAEVLVKVGQTSFPLTPAIELLRKLGRSSLRVLLPRRGKDGAWIANAVPVDSAEDMADAISRWIDSHPLDWAGWPFIVARRQLPKVRDGSSLSI
jgi:hypothetical protein